MSLADQLHRLNAARGVDLETPLSSDEVVFIDSDGKLKRCAITALPVGASSGKTAIIQDQKASGTNAGNSVVGWQTRDLNTEVHDPSGIVSLAGNQFTLGAGVYRIRAYAPAHRCGYHRIRIYNQTDLKTEDEGINAWSSDGLAVGVSVADVTNAIIETVITLADTKALTLDHYQQVAVAGTGLGRACSTGAVERYATVIIQKD